MSAGVILILGILLAVETSRVQFGGFAGSASYVAEKALNDADSTCDEGESGSRACTDKEIHGEPTGRVVISSSSHHPTDKETHHPSSNVMESGNSSVDSDKGTPGK